MRVAELPGGVVRVTHALPWALDHVHCYAVPSADGWTLIDTGLGTQGTASAWQEALAQMGRPRVTRLVLTHYHPDHVGGGALLADLVQPEEIVQGRRDAALARAAFGADRDLEAYRRYLLAHGMPVGHAAEVVAAEVSLPLDMAQPTLLVEEGDRLEMGDENFLVLELPGHAPGHIALLGERSGRLFAGDVLLERITPNVGLWQDSGPDPVRDYLATLDRLAQIRPAVVYPGHEQTIADPVQRVRQLERHHRFRLRAHLDALASRPTTTYEVARRVFGDPPGPHERPFALAEALAHLVHLRELGLAEEVELGRWRRA